MIWIVYISEDKSTESKFFSWNPQIFKSNCIKPICHNIWQNKHVIEGKGNIIKMDRWLIEKRLSDYFLMNDFWKFADYVTIVICPLVNV